MHQRGGELWVEVAGPGGVQLALVVRRDHRKPIQGVEQHVPIKTGGEAIADRLRHCRHARTHDGVDHQLDLRSLAGASDMHRPAPDHREDRPRALEIRRLATYQHHELAGFGFGRAARDGGVQHRDSVLAAGIEQPDRGAG